ARRWAGSLTESLPKSLQVEATAPDQRKRKHPQSPSEKRHGGKAGDNSVEERDREVEANAARSPCIDERGRFHGSSNGRAAGGFSAAAASTGKNRRSPSCVASASTQFQRAAVRRPPENAVPRAPWGRPAQAPDE